MTDINVSICLGDSMAVCQRAQMIYYKLYKFTLFVKVTLSMRQQQELLHESAEALQPSAEALRG